MSYISIIEEAPVVKKECIEAFRKALAYRKCYGDDAAEYMFDGMEVGDQGFLVWYDALRSASWRRGFCQVCCAIRLRRAYLHGT